MILDLMTADVGIDPVSIFNLPSEVRHGLADGVVSTRLSSAAITFEASFETAGATDEELTLDWIEAGDYVCYTQRHLRQVLLRRRDARRARPPTGRGDGGRVLHTVGRVRRRNAGSVFYRDNAQEYVVKRWHNLEV